MRHRHLLYCGLLLAGGAALIAGCGLENLLPTNPAPGLGDANAVYELAGQRFRVETVVGGLEVPWSIAFCPCGDKVYLVERPGRIRGYYLDSGQQFVSQGLDSVAPPLPRSERGLMGLAISPDWNNDRTIYISYTMPDGAGIKNVIDRLRWNGQEFERIDAGPIVDNLPAAFIHDGLPLGFGPDGKLYASTGDATQSARAQDLDYLGGKYLRYNTDGSIPDDNPFPGSPVWSLGHRNSQGFAWHPTQPDLLFATEHGSSFPVDGAGGEDELNRIIRGANYGWPLYRRDATAPGFEAPLWNSGDEAVAPAGATFCDGQRYPAWTNAMLFGSLRGAALFVAMFDPSDPTQLVSVDRGLEGTLGRIRACRHGVDGYIYITTSNRDGRGTPAADDDRLVRLVPVN